MKPLLLAGLFLMLSFSGMCQDSTVLISKFEQLSSQSGQMIKIERRKIGWAATIPVAKVKYTDLVTKSSRYAITLNYSNDASILIAYPSLIYIDMDELDSIIVSLSTFLKETNELKTPEGVRYSYITKSDIMVSCEFLSWTENWRFYISKIYNVLRIPVAESTFQINKKRLPELITLLEQAKTMEW